MKQEKQSETTSNRSRILVIAEKNKEFVAGDDGYFIYWPKGFTGGGFAAHTLRELADELDRKNEEWDKIVSNTN